MCLYEQQIENEDEREGKREREEKRREELIKYAIENKYLNQSIKRLSTEKNSILFYPIGFNEIAII
jgi:hypothetical protein